MRLRIDVGCDAPLQMLVAVVRLSVAVVVGVLSGWLLSVVVGVVGWCCLVDVVVCCC